MVRRASLLTLVLVFSTFTPSLQAQHNTLNITSRPGGAQVYLDDKPRGITSEQGKLVLEELPAGTYQFRISLSGYKDWNQTVTLTEGSTLYVEAALAVPGPAPLAAQDVLDLLQGGVSAKRANVLVKERGVDFSLTEAMEQRIRDAGGDADLLLTITKAKAAPGPSPPPLAPPTIAILEPGEAESGKPVRLTASTFRLLGRAAHPSGIVSVAINGQAARLGTPTPAGVEFEVQNQSPGPDGALAIVATASDHSQGRFTFKTEALPEAPAPGTTKVNAKDGLTYVWIPPGTFQMGCSEGERECHDYESPVHTVTLTKGFWIGRTEVTQGAYQRVQGTNPSWFHGENLPVEHVSWDDANNYCRAVGMRLPTEAEWEYAARAVSTASRYGDPDAIAWYASHGGRGTHAVGQKQPNAWGLYDMLGNVSEWVSDWYDPNYYSGSPSQDPPGPSSGTARVLRGGTWFAERWYIRVSDRWQRSGAWPLDDEGFRCAGDLP